MTKEEFVSQSNKKHKNFYDYSEVEDFKNTAEKVTILCPKHGKFKQFIRTHLLGGEGCKECFKEKKFLSWEDFLKKSKTLYGMKYTYYKEDYDSSHKNTRINCSEHADFLQTPFKHLRGAGCPQCKKKEVRLKKQEEFIRKAKEFHGEIYGYELVEYEGMGKKVKIVCPAHGVYETNPQAHLKGGCHQCYFDLRKKGYYK